MIALGDRVRKVSAKTPDGKNALLTPIFIFKEGKRKEVSASSTSAKYTFMPLKESTISNYSVEYFMDNTQGQGLQSAQLPQRCSFPPARYAGPHR